MHEYNTRPIVAKNICMATVRGRPSSVMLQVYVSFFSGVSNQTNWTLSIPYLKTPKPPRQNETAWSGQNPPLGFNLVFNVSGFSPFLHSFPSSDFRSLHFFF